MGDWHEFSKLLHFSLPYRIVLIATFLATVVFDLTVAVEAGIILSCLFFIYRISSLTRFEAIQIEPPSSEIVVYRVFGSLFFGSVSKLEALSEQRLALPKVMILELHQMISLDATGLDALQRLHRNLRKNGSRLILCGLNHQPESLLHRSGFLAALGPENKTGNLTQAAALAHSHLRPEGTSR
jgi:SulP family sulfate permease